MVNRFITSIIILFGALSASLPGLASGYHVGDVLILSDHKRPDTYIHVGLISIDEKDDHRILLEANESSGCIASDLNQYIETNSKDQTILILRPKEFVEPYNQEELATLINQNFFEYMDGHQYNVAMVMGSESEKGRNYYCSELVMELLNPLLLSKIPTHKMTFESQVWNTIFKFRGYPVPRGKQGISPSDFLSLKSFQLIATISPKPETESFSFSRRSAVISDRSFDQFNRSSRSYSITSNQSLGYSSASYEERKQSTLFEIDSDDEALDQYLGF